MKRSVLAKGLPALTAALGVLGFVLRLLLYALGADQWGLLSPGHPLEAALWLVSAGALVLITVVVWGLDGSPKYTDNFFPSAPAAVGHFLAAAGIGATVLLEPSPMAGSLGLVWRLMGLGSVACLLLAGVARRQGRRPGFGLHLLVCLFLVIHIVSLYRSWSADPQLLDYVFSLFGLVCLVFFAYYTAAFDVGLGKRRIQLGMGLTAVYLNLVGLELGGDLLLRLGCVAWALTDLCTRDPRPKPPKKSQETKTDDPA